MSAILLLLPRNEVKGKIAERIEIGDQLIRPPIGSYAELEDLKTQEKIWSSYNEELLRTLFSTDELAEEYAEMGFGMGGRMPNLDLDINWFRDDIQRYITRLREIDAKLELYQEKASKDAPVTSGKSETPRGDAVFIVHGHAGPEYEVYSVLRELGADAIILKEQPHGGSPTLAEKLEREAAKCGYAVVLFTPDDEGRAKTEKELKPRARENVVVELGFFIGKLGRGHVTILHDPSVDIPSDFRCVAYYPFDAHGA